MVEVFTPIMHNRLDFPQNSHFQIKENEIFDEEYFLRICMELRLRQILKFQIERGVYEIGSCFRKEAESGRICEFRMLELFEIKPSYDDLIKQIINIFKAVYKECNGKDLSVDIIPVIDLVSEDKIEGIRQKSRNDLEFIGQFEKLLDARLIEIDKSKRAYIICDYPVETMSLARRKKENPDFVERFELFADGIEIGHGFTDAMNPDDIENRMLRLNWKDEALLQQLRNKELPESGGFGIGIERLVQVSLEIKSIKDMVVSQII
jgi:lysyl-tRNA synthetase class 2